MKAIDKDNRSLEEVISSLMIAEDLRLITDEAYRARVQIQKIKGELRKYLSRPRKWLEQINFLKEKIREIEEKYPEVKTVLPQRTFE